MTGTLLEQAMSPEILDQSWRRLRGEHTPWNITTSREQLQQHLLRHILQCREEVLSGSYQPQPLRQFPIRKQDGGQRILSAQYLQDKLIQRALLTVLEPRAEALFHEDSYAYRPGRGVAMAIARTRERIRIGLDWLVDADITKLFDSIPHKPLIKQLGNFIKDRQAMHLIQKWIRHGAHKDSFLASPKGISQGAILSPLFCNLYLHGFDSALAKANIPFVRYADDFILFAGTRRQAENARLFADKTLQRLGLQLHPKKTRIARSGPHITFLGDKLPSPNR